ncbi:MAG: phosphatidate cytidylyltransferase [Chitinophagaceae bacterium]|nr:phosphatidate cytidylyltransferase [Chitinophagaceae bacterium]
MALNLKTFKTRALTALLFVAVMLTGLLWNLWSFLILFTIIHFGCWYEFVKLMKKMYRERYVQYCLFGLIYITLPIVLMFFLHQKTIVVFSNVESNAAYFPAEYSESFRFTILIFTIAVIWINDTMAYLVGSFIGKTPLTKISPKKTWEGTLGGAILAIGVGIIFAKVIHLQVFHVSLITAAIAIFGTLGDLLESKLKRMADVKDSGSFMPGHGGFLDRFDSLLVAVPAVWVYLYFFI